MKEFAGRVALVTGTTGIGRAIAKRFAEGGAQVVACGIEATGNEELAREPVEKNLAYRAVKALRRELKVSDGVEIELRKTIPSA